MGKEVYQLKDNHTWRAKPGHSICVLERGLVRFEYPSHWIVEPDGGALMLHDRPKGVECCDLGVTIFPLPGADLSKIDMDLTLHQAIASERNVHHESEIRRINEPDREIVWLEQHYIDQEYNRQARFRVALARGPLVCLVSLNYWTDRATELEPVWDHVIATFTFGQRITDPTRGPLTQ